MHEYLKRIFKAQQNGAILTTPGAFHSTAVEHDPSCGVYKKGECNCDPKIIVTTWAPHKQPSADLPAETFTIDAEGRRHPLRSDNA